jgi:hypothetical protein
MRSLLCPKGNAGSGNSMIPVETRHGDEVKALEAEIASSLVGTIGRWMRLRSRFLFLALLA